MLPSRALLLASLFLSLASNSTRAQEQTARLVRDLNRTPQSFPADIRWVLPLGKGAVFAMDTATYGSEPWITDGTAKGTRLLKDVLPGAAGSIPDQPLAFAAGTKVAFHKEGWSSGDELWVTDGTTVGTVQTFVGPAPGASVEIRTKAGTTGGVFFEKAAANQEGSRELLFTDGTTAGTWTLNPGPSRFAQPFGYLTSGPWCYFIANEDEVWRSDGTDAGTTKLLTISTGMPQALGFVGGKLFVEVKPHPILVTTTLNVCPMDGGELTQLHPDSEYSRGWLEKPVALGDQLFFTRRGGSFEGDLWTSDGTSAGTRMIALPEEQGLESVRAESVTQWNGSIYFTTERPDHVESLWRTDGTPTGTLRLMSSGPSSDLEFLALVGTPDFLYILTPSFTLWRTQGDVASTRRVKGVKSDYNSDDPQLAGTESGLIFSPGRYISNEGLWHLPGKKTKATQLTRSELSTASAMNPDYPIDSPSRYEMTGGNLLAIVNSGSGFSARDHELWSIPPDGGKTRAIWKPKNPTIYWGVDFQATTARSALFTYSDGEDVFQTWTTDGTSRGTRLLGPGASDFVKLGDLCFYIAYPDHSPSQLWKTDGTKEGTSPVVDTVIPSPEYSELVAFQDHVYFLSTTDAHTTLWRSDGTAEGTVWVADIGSGQVGETAERLSVAAGKLLFYVKLINGRELWQSDGTTAGTVPVNPPATFVTGTVSEALDLGDRAIFRARATGDPGTRWWCHDAAGTRPVRADMIGQSINGLGVAAGSQVFYAGREPVDGTSKIVTELWATDGTSDGTRKVKAINPGETGAAITELLAVGDEVYFSATDVAHGAELWRSDGTEAGTVLVADIEPGQANSSPSQLKVMGDKLYFIAQRRDVGWELFSVDLPQ